MNPYVSVSQWVVTVDFCPQIKAGIEPANPPHSSMWELQWGVFAAQPAVKKMV